MTFQLFLRTTDASGKSYGGFQWPMEVGATVEAPDWDDTPRCGGGLHGLLNGEGDASHLSVADDAIWWIVETEDAVDLGGKHKFRSCTVVVFGPRFEIANEMKRLTGAAGDRGTATAGNGGTATAGDRGTATAGDGGTIVFTSWRNGRRRYLVGYVGEDGIEPDTAYRASDDFTKIITAE